MSEELTVYGKIPAKSSGRRIIVNPKTRRPMVISSAEVIQYEADFLSQVCRKEPIFDKDDLLYVRLIIYAMSRRQDIDSYPKVVLDCLERAGLIYNDNRVDQLYIVRLIDKQNPRVVITIEKIGGRG